MTDASTDPKRKASEAMKEIMAAKIVQLAKNKDVPIAGVIIATLILAVLIVITIVFWPTNTKGGRVGVGIVVLILNIIQFGIAFHYLYKRQREYANTQKEFDAAKKKSEDELTEMKKQSDSSQGLLKFIEETHNIGTAQDYARLTTAINEAYAKRQKLYDGLKNAENIEEYSKKLRPAEDAVEEATAAMNKFKADANKHSEAAKLITAPPATV